MTTFFVPVEMLRELWRGRRALRAVGAIPLLLLALWYVYDGLFHVQDMLSRTVDSGLAGAIVGYAETAVIAGVAGAWLSRHMMGQRPSLWRLLAFIVATVLIAGLHDPIGQMIARFIDVLKLEHGTFRRPLPNDRLFSGFIWAMGRTLDLALWSFLSLAQFWISLWLLGHGLRLSRMAQLTGRLFWGVFLAQFVIELLWRGREAALAGVTGLLYDRFDYPSPFDGPLILLFGISSWVILFLGYGLIAALWRRAAVQTQ